MASVEEGGVNNAKIQVPFKPLSCGVATTHRKRRCRQAPLVQARAFL